MKKGQLIHFNKGLFEVIFIDSDEIRLRRTTEPKIRVLGIHKKNEKTIKLIGWDKYAPYELAEML